MLDKLLSALPYNPSIIHQLSFYSKRIRKEETVRKAGFIFIFLAFLIQFFVFISPPQPTLAQSPNDLINGGIAGAANPAFYAANVCNSNIDGYGTILNDYDISCSEVHNAPTIVLNSDSHNKDLFSMGRAPNNTLAGETQITLGGVTYYARYLWAWDKPGTSSNYYALDVTTASGRQYFILYNCGNLVSIGPFPALQPPPTIPPAVITPPTPCSELLSSEDTIPCVTPAKSAQNLTQGISNANGTTAQAGDLIKYTLYADNTGTTEVKDYIFSDNLTYVLDYASVVSANGSTFDSSTQSLIFPEVNILPKQTAEVSFEVKVDNPIPETPPSTSDPNYYNMTMVNTYGNTITINLPNAPIQTVETAAASLPNTGPGDGVIIAAAVTFIVGFFYYRSRLLAKESVIAIKESSGGMQ